MIVTGGIEDTLRLERGIQTYLGYPYSDRLHVATHFHNEPPAKGSRGVWWRGGFEETAIFEQDDVLAGHAIAGPAVVESPANTFAIPPGHTATMDRNRIWHLPSGDR